MNQESTAQVNFGWQNLAEELGAEAKERKDRAGIALAAGIILLLLGVGFTAWHISYPFEGSAVATASSTEIAQLISTRAIDLAVLSVVVLGSRMLFGMYKFNMQLFVHYRARELAVRIAPRNDLKLVVKLLRLLEPRRMNFDSLPDQPFFPLVEERATSNGGNEKGTD